MLDIGQGYRLRVADSCVYSIDLKLTLLNRLER